MALQLTTVDPDIFTIDNVYSTDECRSLIERAESIGFEAASVRTRGGPQMMTNVRNNDRVVLTDPVLADDMWARVTNILPSLDDSDPCGVDDSLRFYRYVPGQRFKRHKDGSVTDEQGNTSKLSFLIYLNDNCVGGTTVFRDYDKTSENLDVSEQVIEPAIGKALLFRHHRWHEGTPVIEGRKYVLRTDVFYSQHGSY